MGQQEVFEWLKDSYLDGDIKYFSFEEIRQAMENGNGSHRERAVRRQLNQLVSYGHVDVRVKETPGRFPGFKRTFRISKKHVEG